MEWFVSEPNNCYKFEWFCKYEKKNKLWWIHAKSKSEAIEVFKEKNNRNEDYKVTEFTWV